MSKVLKNYYKMLNVFPEFDKWTSRMTIHGVGNSCFSSKSVELGKKVVFLMGLEQH